MAGRVRAAGPAMTHFHGYTDIMTANTDMRAIVVEKAGSPETFSYRSYPIPEAKPGWILVRVRAFGLNRSEQMTRDGHSPNVEFPRVLGIEAVGEVVEDGLEN